MSYPANVEKNEAIVLLKKAGMPMRRIIRVFGGKRSNFYRVWYRDKSKYFIKDGNNKQTETSPQK